MDDGKYYSIIIIGEQKSGKTTLAAKMIAERNKGTLIIDPDGMEKSWKDVPEITLEQLPYMKQKAWAKLVFDNNRKNPDIWNIVRSCTVGKLLVIDDGSYCLRSNRGEELVSLFCRTRQSSRDMFWIAHGLSKIPPDFWTYATHLILFRTTDGFERKKENLPNYDILRDLVFEVNREAVKDKHYHKIVQLREP